jgi:hypothetical protein
MSFIKLDAEGNYLPDDATNHAIVEDEATGLQYAVRAEGFDQMFAHGQAVAAVAALNHAGGQNWRLPTPQEQFAIVKFVAGGIVADLNLFPDMRAHWYWTDQPAPGVDDHFFAVYFCQGHVGFLKSSNQAFARPVRSTVAAGANA